MHILLFYETCEQKDVYFFAKSLFLLSQVLFAGKITALVNKANESSIHSYIVVNVNSQLIPWSNL